MPACNATVYGSMCVYMNGRDCILQIDCIFGGLCSEQGKITPINTNFYSNLNLTQKYGFALVFCMWKLSCGISLEYG